MNNKESTGYEGPRPSPPEEITKRKWFVQKPTNFFTTRVLAQVLTMRELEPEELLDRNHPQYTEHRLEAVGLLSLNNEEEFLDIKNRLERED